MTHFSIIQSIYIKYYLVPKLTICIWSCRLLVSKPLWSLSTLESESCSDSPCTHITHFSIIQSIYIKSLVPQIFWSRVSVFRFFTYNTSDRCEGCQYRIVVWHSYSAPPEAEVNILILCFYRSPSSIPIGVIMTYPGWFRLGSVFCLLPSLWPLEMPLFWTFKDVLFPSVVSFMK